MSDTRILDFSRASTAHKLVGQAVAQLQIARTEISEIMGESCDTVAVAIGALEAVRELYTSLDGLVARLLRAAERQ